MNPKEFKKRFDGIVREHKYHYSTTTQEDVAWLVNDLKVLLNNWEDKG